MRRHFAMLAFQLLVLATPSWDSPALASSGPIRGEVQSPGGRPLPGVTVNVRSVGGSHSVSTMSAGDGSYSLLPPPGDSLVFFVLHRGDTLLSTPRVRSDGFRLKTARSVDSFGRKPSSWWLGSLPDGEEKRRFILDCTGCHQFNETRVNHEGARRSRQQWAEDTRRMLRYAGARSGFPVIAADRDPERTAEWLTTHLAATRPAAERDEPTRDGQEAERAEITEYDLPEPGDLPHDIAVDNSGRVLITGMFTNVIYRLDPATGAHSPTEIPIPKANPRAIEIDRSGAWWVLLGGPKKVARYTPGTGEWDSWDIGMYPHSIALSPDGRSVWFNGHFTRDPEEMGRLDPDKGTVQRFTLPSHPELAGQGGPVPYEQRIGADGTVWMSELQGNRLLRLDPGTGNVRVHDLPVRWSGPRRFDFDSRGDLWIPAYSGGALWKLNARTETFQEFPLPVKDALPYVARVSPRDGRVWIGTAGADAVFSFDPRSERFRFYPLPTRGVTVRHLAIDSSRGEIWLAYGASPALHPARVARLRPID